MRRNWVQAKLGDYIDTCLGKMLDKNKNTGEYHPYLGNSNVRWGSFDLDALSEMKFEAHEHERYGIKKGDLIICEGGEPGRCAIWEDNIPNMKIQKALHRVRTLPGLDSEYLYYWFLFSTRAGRIDPFFTGTTIKHLTGKALKEVPILIPPLEYQQDVARLLRGFDKKITLNRQINQTLEQMAQALFKSWFVDFDPVVDNALDAGFFEQNSDLPEELLRRAEQRKIVRQQPDFKPLPVETRQLFPAAFEECEEPSLGLGGWVPKGWRVQSCDDVSEKIGMGPFGSNIKVSTFVESGVPVISGAHLKGVLLEDGAYNFITEEHALKLNNSCVYRGDVIFTHAGSIGQVSIIPEGSRYDKYIISQRQFYLRPDREKVVGNYIVYFFHSVAGQHKLLSNASQTGVPSIARPSTHLKNIRLVVPSVEVQHVFDFNIRGWNEKIMKSRENIFSLTKLRDTLLPKLISGELRLSDDGTLASGNTDC